MSHEVTLYTRTNCGLCDEAAAELRRLRTEFDFTLTERDIDADAGLRARYDERVPVIAVGDRIVAEAPVDALALRVALAAALR